MKDLSSTIDTLAIDIESANNLLLCFEDFCDNNFRMSNSKTSAERQITALYFAEQLPRYRTLLFAAENILANSFKTLEDLAFNIGEEQ